MYLIMMTYTASKASIARAVILTDWCMSVQIARYVDFTSDINERCLAVKQHATLRAGSWGIACWSPGHPANRFRGADTRTAPAQKYNIFIGRNLLHVGIF